ncbi:hypothetical protein BaRGS_00026056, partial [Batillaria attramentaria]
MSRRKINSTRCLLLHTSLTQTQSVSQKQRQHHIAQCLTRRRRSKNQSCGTGPDHVKWGVALRARAAHDSIRLTHRNPQTSQWPAKNYLHEFTSNKSFCLFPVVQKQRKRDRSADSVNSAAF